MPPLRTIEFEHESGKKVIAYIHDIVIPDNFRLTRDQIIESIYFEFTNESSGTVQVKGMPEEYSDPVYSGQWYFSVSFQYETQFVYD
jgi:hypothetical protein